MNGSSSNPSTQILFILHVNIRTSKEHAMSPYNAFCPGCKKEMTFNKYGVVQCPHCEKYYMVMKAWPDPIIQPWSAPNF